MKTISGTEINAMVEHWLRTPAGSYLGSDYGQNGNDLLQRPMFEGAANAFIRKMREDIPILEALPADAVTIYGRQIDIDKVEIVLEVAGRTYNLSSES